MDENEKPVVIRVVTALALLAALGASSCIYKDNALRNACIGRGGVPQEFGAYTLCMAAPLGTKP